MLVEEPGGAGPTARCDRFGIAHSGIQPTPAGPQLDICDPDGTVLRFYHYTDATATVIAVHCGVLVNAAAAQRSREEYADLASTCLR
jgi:hypothetical protein